MAIYNKFYNKTIKERISILKNAGLYDESLDINLKVDEANRLSENVITTFELPFGVAPNLLVDGIKYNIPLVTEEPSVVAALANAAKIFSVDGFKTNVYGRLMIGQIFFMPNINNLESLLKDNQKAIFDVAEKSHPSIYKRGGGLKSFSLKTYQKDSNNYQVIYFKIDVKEAMGANIVNTILEALKDYFNNLGYPVLMAILSNLATESLVSATVKINVDKLKGGLETAEKIALATTYANLDNYRAATHNKGVMNGISALFLATGNDTRVIESSIHAYASLDGYKAITNWQVIGNDLVGNIKIPCTIGSVSKQLNVLSKAKLAHKILNNPSAETLMSITASVGLAQNFAALYALTTDGIQKGHMSLHNRLNK